MATTLIPATELQVITVRTRLSLSTYLLTKRPSTEGLRVTKDLSTKATSSL